MCSPSHADEGIVIGLETDEARHRLKPPEGQLAVDRLRGQVRKVKCVDVADELDAVVHDSGGIAVEVAHIGRVAGLGAGGRSAEQQKGGRQHGGGDIDGGVACSHDPELRTVCGALLLQHPVAERVSTRIRGASKGMVPLARIVLMSLWALLESRVYMSCWSALSAFRLLEAGAFPRGVSTSDRSEAGAFPRGGRALADVRCPPCGNPSEE